MKEIWGKFVEDYAVKKFELIMILEREREREQKRGTEWARGREKGRDK